MASQEHMERLGDGSSSSSSSMSSEDDADATNNNNDNNNGGGGAALSSSSDDDGSVLDDDKPVDERMSVEDSDISDDDDDDDDDESQSSSVKPRIKLNLRLPTTSSPNNNQKKEEPTEEAKEAASNSTTATSSEKKTEAEAPVNGSNNKTVEKVNGTPQQEAPTPMEIEPTVEPPKPVEQSVTKVAAVPSPVPSPEAPTAAPVVHEQKEAVKAEESSSKVEDAMEIDEPPAEESKPSDDLIKSEEAKKQEQIVKSEEQVKSEEVVQPVEAKSDADKVTEANNTLVEAKHVEVNKPEDNSQEEAKAVKIEEEAKAVKIEEGREANAINGSVPAPAPSPAQPALSKIMKKKLPKLPLNTKRKLPLKGGEPSSKVAKATIVGSSNASTGSNDVVATAVSSSAKKSTTSSKPKSSSSTGGTATTKKKPSSQSRVIRMPPITSPGLLLPPSSGNYRGPVDASNTSGFLSPASLFDQAMASAGYTTDTRTKRPHRGSSVKRNVGDMFDSNVAFTLRFPDLIPKELWYRPKKKGPEELHPVVEQSESKTPLPDLLLKSLEKDVNKGKQQKQDNNGSRKRQRPACWQFEDMIPLSLTLPYPESYIQKRLEYVKLVKEREKFIIKYQEKQEELEIKRQQQELLQGNKDGQESERQKINNPIKVPPIPTPPEPPKITELEGIDADQYEDLHPIYLPKGKKNFVAHLDKDCFHITEGRYFGLNSNFIADPHFVGANAPGISGLTLSCGSGLATSSAANSGGGGPGVLAVSGSIFKEKDTMEKDKAPKKESEKKPPPKPPKKATASLPGIDKSAKNKFKLKHVGPTPTANSSDLRKIMEEGGEFAEKMKTCIIRAAVHASRSGKHGQAFLAPDGKAYPDVSKAFAAHAGLKPCLRCKNNKQGAYHCRLRRKHKELDYDGTNSPAELAPLLLEPMEDLLLNPNKKTTTSNA